MGDAIGSLNLQGNTWYHVWAWYDQNYVRFHVENEDGTSTDFKYSAYNGGISPTISPLYFGRTVYNTGPYDHYKGIIDNVVIMEWPGL
jgi:hypothetical protein